MSSGLPKLTLILGGQRSGKSQLAERLIEDAAGGGVYIATAEAADGEMQARIDAHRARRGAGWRTVEEPVDPLAAVLEHAGPNTPVLIDCLTLWLSNLMAAGRDVPAAVDALAAGLGDSPGPVVIVSNEVGLGVIPMNAMAREFADHAGRANQRLARAADRVLLSLAGLYIALKDQR
ncbi:MAG: bifunctional adenosylcobinamide kinase/adenosylcobinamide-phosphate guanylyltransferase [Rhodospirillaceae bacterium]